MSRTFKLIIAAFCATFLTLTARAEDLVQINFVNSDIASVVSAIGMPLGKTFIIDPRVTGNMNIISPAPVTKAMAYQILLSALRVQGYAAIETGNVVKIVPEADAKTSGTVIDPSTRISGDRIVTQVFPLQNESAAQLASVLRPLVAPNNFIGAYPGNNTLVVTDYAENIKRIAKIIASIDIPSANDMQLIKIEYASAVDIANTLKGLMPELTPNPNSPGAPPKLAIGVEPRSNSLIVRADSPALVTRIKTLVSTIDTPTAANGNIHVVYLRNAEATKLAETLRGLLAGGAVAQVSSPAASTTAPNTSTGAASGQVSAAANSTIQAYAPNNSLIITASDHVYASLRGVIEKLDQRRAQVSVEALIVEVSNSVAAELGIQWQDLSGLNRSGEGSQVIGGTNFGVGSNIITAAADLRTVGGGLNIGIVRGRINIPGLGEVIGLGGLARAFQNDQRANVLATPNIMALDNDEGKIVVGQNVPFVTGSFTTSNTGAANPFQTIERKDIGLTLRVTPQVTEGGTVKLKTFLEVSSVAAVNSTIRSADLITNKRSIESTVLVDNDEIFVIGGLIQDDTRNGESKVPILGDLPWVGGLFRTQTKLREKTNLMVFLRPKILRDAKAASALSQDRYDYIRGEQSRAASDLSGLAPQGSATLPPSKK